MEAYKIVLALIKSEIKNTPLESNVLEGLDEYALKAIYTFSKGQSLTPMVAFALAKAGKFDDSEYSKKLQNEMFTYIAYHQHQKAVLTKIRDTFEAAKIPFIVLKGWVIKKYYPQEWMRTSCDIDVLVKPDDLNKAKDILINDLGYTFGVASNHDITIMAPNNVTIELHFELFSDDSYDIEGELNVWQYTYPAKNGGYEYFMNDEMYYFYHIFHMAKHFQNGGCGIRTFADLWIMKNVAKMRKDEEMLKSYGYFEFDSAADSLAEVWFNSGVKDKLSQQMESYVISGGIYGITENSVLVKQIQKNGKLGYIISRIFMPYKKMCFYFPVLNNHKWLLPFCWFFRLFSPFRNGTLKSRINEVRINSSISNEQLKQARELLYKLGIK